MPTSLTVAVLAAAAIAAGFAGSVLVAAAAPAATPRITTTPPTSTTPPTITTPVAPPPIDVQVSRTRVGRPIAPGFLGFSIEYRAVRAYTGTNPNAINPVLVQLIRDVNQHQSPV